MITAIEELRSFRVSDIHIESRAAGGTRKLVGHAAVFDLLSDPIADGYRERVMPGAFAKTLAAGADVRALINHNPNYVLGRTKSGTLKLEEDARGLAIEIQLPDTTFAHDLVASVERRDIDQMSFAFRAVRDRQTFEGGQPVRELLEVELFDVSPVTFPAYPQTDLQARSRGESSDAKWPATMAVLERNGIDPSALFGALFRVNSGAALPRDAAMLDGFRSRLQAMLPESARPQPSAHVARYGYVLIDDDDMPANVRDAAAETFTRVVRELGIPAAGFAWFDNAAEGRTADFRADLYLDGRAAYVRKRDEALILIRRGLSLERTIHVVAHELRHVQQMRGEDIAKRTGTSEYDANTYARRVVDQHRADDGVCAAYAARRQRGWW